MTFAGSFKSPPVWMEDQIFASWKAEFMLWTLVTDLDEKKRGVAVALYLSGRRREVAMEVPSTDLNEDGLESLLNKLETVFRIDTVDAALISYDSFESVKRLGQTIAEYIQNFEMAHKKLKKHQMVIPDNILACKLLRNVELEEKERQMALAATRDLSYYAMKTALKRIFASTTASKSTLAVSLKEEPTFATSNDNVFLAGSKNRKSGKPFFNKPESSGNNPVGKDGKVTNCRVCGCRFHWACFCPEDKQDIRNNQRNGSQDEGEEHKTFLTFISGALQLIKESSNSAIVDTVCLRTVAGENWLHQFVQRLPYHLANGATFQKSSAGMVFGDGRR